MISYSRHQNEVILLDQVKKRDDFSYQMYDEENERKKKKFHTNLHQAIIILEIFVVAIDNGPLSNDGNKNKILQKKCIFLLDSELCI